MAIVVSCQCGQRFQARDEWAGRRTKCPSCGADLVIPPKAGQPGASSPGQPGAASPPTKPRQVAGKPGAGGARAGQRELTVDEMLKLARSMETLAGTGEIQSKPAPAPSVPLGPPMAARPSPAPKRGGKALLIGALASGGVVAVAAGVVVYFVFLRPPAPTNDGNLNTVAAANEAKQEPPSGSPAPSAAEPLETPSGSGARPTDGPTPAATERVEAGETKFTGKMFTSKECGFVVCFPSAPTIARDRGGFVPKLRNAPVAHQKFSWSRDGGARGVLLLYCFELPDGYPVSGAQFLATELDWHERGAVDAGNERHRVPISLGEARGEELSSTGGGWRSIIRGYVKGNRVYELGIGGFKEDPSGKLPTYAQEFLDSFRLLSADETDGDVGATHTDLPPTNPAVAPKDSFRAVPLLQPLAGLLEERTWGTGDPREWKESAGDGYTVTFPGVPQENVLVKVPTLHPGARSALLLHEGWGLVFCVCSVSNKESYPPTTLVEQMARDVMAQEAPLSKTSITLGEHKGVEAIAEHTRNGLSVKTAVRTYATEKMGYAVVVAGAKANFSDALATKFFDSFRITARDWQEFALEGFGFSVVGPGKPYRVDNDLMTSFRFYDRGTELYRVNCQLPREGFASPSLNIHVDVMVLRRDKPKLRLPIAIGKFRAEELWIQRFAQTPEAEVFRCVAVREKVYSIGCLNVPLQNSGRPSLSEDAKRFFDSFKLLDEIQQ